MVPSVNGLKKAPKICLVCGITKASTHFGAVVCMACASFFRRTVSFNIRFLCRYSNQCRIAQDLRFICRSCRFDKCEAVGMQRHMVQAKRNDNKLPKYVLESRKEGVREVVRGYITSAYNTPGRNSILESSPEETSSEVGELERFSTILNVKHEELMLYYVKEIKNAMASREAAEVDLSEHFQKGPLVREDNVWQFKYDEYLLLKNNELYRTEGIINFLPGPKIQSAKEKCPVKVF